MTNKGAHRRLFLIIKVGGGIPFLDDLRAFIEGNSSARVTIIAHSMGGLVAAYMIAAEDEEWVKSHIASVVTFDSPLQGLPSGYIDNWNSIIRRILDRDSACSPETNFTSVNEMDEDSETVNKAKSAGLNVSFYTLDATTSELPRPIRLIVGGDGQLVPNGKSGIEKEWWHAEFRQKHGEIWDKDSPQRKKLIIGCAIIISTSCNNINRAP